MDWPPRFPDETRRKVQHSLSREQGALSRARLYDAADRIEIEIEDALCQCPLEAFNIFMDAMCELARAGAYEWDSVQFWDEKMLAQFVQDTLNNRGRDWQGQALNVTVEDIIGRLPERFRVRRQERLDELWQWRISTNTARPLFVRNSLETPLNLAVTPFDAATGSLIHPEQSWVLPAHETAEVPDWVSEHFKDELKAYAVDGPLIRGDVPPPQTQQGAELQPASQETGDPAEFTAAPETSGVQTPPASEPSSSTPRKRGRPPKFKDKVIEKMLQMEAEGKYRTDIFPHVYGTEEKVTSQGLRKLASLIRFHQTPRQKNTDRKAPSRSDN